jgi:hypothetical protein
MPSTTALTRANDQAIRRALEIAGVEFSGFNPAAIATSLLFFAI